MYPRHLWDVHLKNKHGARPITIAKIGGRLAAELPAQAYKRPQTADLNPTTGTTLWVPSDLHQSSDT